MDKSQIKLYQDRWQALNEIEKQEASADTIEVRWQKVNTLYGMAKALGIKPDEEQEDNIVRARWLKLIKNAGL